MIKFYDQVPSVYINTSRDFQYLSWLIDIVLNSVKHSVDDIYNLPNTKADPRLTELLAMTLGFKVKRYYNQDQLAILVSLLPNILKYKGTLKAIQLAGTALISGSGANGKLLYRVENNCLTVILPKELVDITLFMDLLPYILPAGMTCHIVRETIDDYGNSTDMEYNDSVIAQWYEDLDWNTTKQNSIGLAQLYDIDAVSRIPEFTYNKTKDIPNTGMLDTTIIPALDSVLGDGNDTNTARET